MTWQEWIRSRVSWINNAAHFLFPGICELHESLAGNLFFPPWFFYLYASHLIMNPCRWHIDQPCKHKYTHVQGHKLCLVNGNTLVMSLSWTAPMWWVNGCSLAGKNYHHEPANLRDRLSPRSCRSVSFANRILCYLSFGLYLCATERLPTPQ